MIIMSVDLGDARTGIAVSDKTESFAFPKGVITEYNKQKRVQKVADMAKEFSVEMIVVGLPKNMDGSLGFRAEECSEAAEEIRAATGLEVVLWDERCTTVLAHNLLNATDTRGKKRKDRCEIGCPSGRRYGRRNPQSH